jgi:hypothetical protein
MAIKKFAFIVEGDVFMLIAFPDTSPKSEAWVAGLSSSPVIIDVSDNNEVLPGYFWDGEKFIKPDND